MTHSVNKEQLLSGRVWLDVVLGLMLGVLSYPLYLYLFGIAIVRFIPLHNTSTLSILILSVSLLPNLIIYYFGQKRYPIFIFMFLTSGCILSAILYLLLMFGILVGPPPEIHG